MAASIKRLGVILQDIEDFESEQGLDERQKTTIEEMSQACQKVLTELKNELDKYQELDHEEENLGKRTRRVWKRLQWDQSKINGFRKRIDSNMILFNNVITGLNGFVLAAAPFHCFTFNFITDPA